MTEARLVLTAAELLVGLYLGRRSWRRLRFRCARRPAILWFVGVNVLFVLFLTLTYLTGDRLAASASLMSLAVANFLIGPTIRFFGGPDPVCLQRRFHSIAGLLLPESRTDATIQAARTWIQDLRTVRTGMSGRAIDAAHAAIDASYGPSPADIPTRNAKWEAYHDAIIALQRNEGTDPRD